MRRLLVLAAVLCALPASGDQTVLPPAVVVALTPLDALPSKSDVDNAFTPGPALDNLIAIARDTTADLGVALHAIRMLPLYCSDPASCGTGTPVHDTLFAIVSDYTAALARSPLSPQDALRMRAAIEALGATHSALTGDADLLSSSALLDHASRDVRVTVVRALRSLASCDAVNPLKRRNVNEPSPQVKLAIVGALQSLALQCPP
jgi:hypothetical protein